MKIKCLLLFLLLGTGQGYAQKLGKRFFEKNNSIGGFGKLTLGAAPNHSGYFSGEGAIRFMNFYLGGFGYNHVLKSTQPKNSSKLFNRKFSNGGILIGASSGGNTRIGAFVDLQIGFGKMEYSHQLAEHVYQQYETQTISVMPRLGVSLNCTRFMELHFFAAYNLVSVAQNNLMNQHLEEIPSIGMSLVLGALK